MILIKSSYQDVSTIMVAEWLLHFGENFILIDEDDPISHVSYRPPLSYCISTSSNKHFCLQDIKSYWYRRGDWTFDVRMLEAESKKPEFKDFTSSEWRILSENISSILKSKNGVGNYIDSKVNKLNVLEAAREIGFKIPRTLVTTKKQDVLDNFGDCEIINKTLGDILLTQIGDMSYSNRTVEVISGDLPDEFFPSLFQEKIKKKYELRVFVLNNQIFPMAIFSQNDKQTEIDYRNYNYLNPNRNVPYKLPQDIERKAILLMGLLELKSGSIDIIVSSNREYYFLEVNPDGQFGMVSNPCNYQIEKRIAQYLLV